MPDSSPFDVLAEEYDAVRASYVPELIDDVLAFAGLPADGHVLEVGCGPGTATRLFAPRVPRLTAVEPSARFVEIVRGHMNEHPHVDVVNAKFDDWDGPERAFDLLYGARSFQWLPADVRFAKPAHHLKPGGTLALFWHWPVLEPGSLLEEIQDACDDVWPPPKSGTRLRGVDERIQVWLDRFATTDAFDEPAVTRYPWTRDYDADTFVRLMNTWPLHRHLDDASRCQLEERIRAIFERRGGSEIGAYETGLFLTTAARS